MIVGGGFNFSFLHRLLCVLGARRKRAASLNISFPDEEGRRRRGGEAGDGVEASVKRCSVREAEGEAERGGKKAPECCSVKVTQRRGGPAGA